MEILMLESSVYGDDISLDKFDKLGNVTKYEQSNPSEALERLKKHNPDVVIVNKILMNKEAIDAAPNLKVIAEAATGYNNIDIEYAKEKGIRVANVAGYSTDSVVQHTFALLFYLYEKMRHYDEFVKDGSYANWPVFSYFNNIFYELKGKKWGIVGLGNIGSKVAKIAADFGCEVLTYSASGHKYDSPYRQVELDELLKESDIISIHAPLNEYTNNLFNYENLSKMKKSAVLLNLGRGPIVNDADLAKALEEGRISAAGLDVISVEPIAKDNPLLKIKDSDKLIITPHIAWATHEARERLMDEIYENIVAYFDGRERNVIV
ncbi:D-2-hydroxyacid dehydrogenase [Lachnospira pectinoschiza]|uniref:Glycerate dehydrogenase n=1 Tax=Lachnospira pectinoschiza TaxID=28052 RepID=A0A1G9SML2_9FIRM|nr:D-2-hydroxyacid dehydrogenase [Lachnospira pectinoschiza]SDM36716.1 glycerate dehydrogenase [Lachnospira pectinoschiza]